MGLFGKIGGVGVAFLAAFAASQLLLAKPASPREAQAKLEKDVAEIKKTLPQKPHELVTWFDIEAGPMAITYKYQVHVPRQVVMAKRAELETQLKKSLTVDVAKLFMPKGVKVDCELYDDHKSYLFAINLD